jgi:hypothetical protein
MRPPAATPPPSEHPQSSAWEPLLQKTEVYAKEKPTQALSAAFGLGLVLALLPLGSLLTGIVRLLLLLLRPLLIVLGLVKLYEEIARAQAPRIQGIPPETPQEPHEP